MLYTPRQGGGALGGVCLLARRDLHICGGMDTFAVSMHEVSSVGYKEISRNRSSLPAVNTNYMAPYFSVQIGFK